MNYIAVYFYNIFKYVFDILIVGVLIYSWKEHFYNNFSKIKSWRTIIPEKKKKNHLLQSLKLLHWEYYL